MIKKTTLRKSPLLTIRMYEPDKEALRKRAEKLGLQLTPYCRMVLLKSLEE